MSLPDDVLLEIITRVKDVAALFRCATACKGWCRLLISDHAYLRRRCLPEDVCRWSPFAGILTQQPRRDGNPVPWVVPGPRPVLGPRGVLRGFVSGMGDFAEPLTSRHGLLLVRVGKLLILCNPLAGTFRPLPPLNLNHRWGSSNYLTGYAILTAADCSCSQDDDQFTFFKVMVITMARNPMHYRLYTYPSSDGKLGWTVSAGILGDQGHAVHVLLLQHNAVICGGAAHWFFRGRLGFYIVDVSANTGHVSARKVKNTRRKLLCDPNYDEPYLSLDAVGRLSFLCLRSDGSRLDLRTCDNSGPDSHIMLEPPSRQINSLIEQGVVHTCLAEKNGKLVIKDDHQRIYVADMKTRVMQEITDFPRHHGLSRKEIVPLEIDWPVLFVSRLGSLAT